MPIGMLVMRWNKKMGAETLARYPEDLNIQDATLLQLYSQHEYTAVAGFITIVSGINNLASYYTGAEKALYIILSLSADEDGTVYEEALVDISNQIVANEEDTDNLEKILPNIFNRISVYPSMSQEQRYAVFYENAIKRMVLDRLREDCLIPKSELTVWLRDEKQKDFVDIEGLVNDFVKLGLLKVASVKGLASDLLFMIGDLIMMRTPIEALVSNPIEHHCPELLKDSYIMEVQNFFKAYRPTTQDNLEIIQKVILDPQVYECLKLLRDAIVTRNDLEKLKKKGVEDLDKCLRILFDLHMIHTFLGEQKVEYYCLISDFIISKIFPRYELDRLRNHYRTKRHNDKVLLQALDILRDEYYSILKGKSPIAKNKPVVKNE